MKRLRLLTLALAVAFGLVAALTACDGGDDENDDVDDDTDDDTGNEPAAPSNLDATPTSDTEVQITWQDNSDNENGFKIERKTGGDKADWQHINTVGPDVETFTDTALFCETSYNYRIRAFNADGDSEPSNEDSDTMGTCTPSGKGLQVTDPTSSATGKVFWYDSNYLNDPNDEPFVVEWDWKWVDGNGMAFEVFVSYQGEYARTIWITFLNIDKATPRIEAVDGLGDGSGNWVNCVSSVNYGQWYHLKLEVDPYPTERYTLYVDGNPTDCENLDFMFSGYYIRGVAWLAFSDVTGGNTHSDNLVINKNGERIFDENWEAYTVGEPPAGPWQIQDEGVDFTVVSLD